MPISQSPIRADARSQIADNGAVFEAPFPNNFHGGRNCATPIPDCISKGYIGMASRRTIFPKIMAKYGPISPHDHNDHRMGHIQG